jgi:hypothetical protein
MVKYWLIEKKKQSIYSFLCLSDWVFGTADGCGLGEVIRKADFFILVNKTNK